MAIRLILAVSPIWPLVNTKKITGRSQKAWVIRMVREVLVIFLKVDFKVIRIGRRDSTRTMKRVST